MVSSETDDKAAVPGDSHIVAVDDQPYGARRNGPPHKCTLLWRTIQLETPDRLPIWRRNGRFDSGTVCRRKDESQHQRGAQASHSSSMALVAISAVA